MIKNIFSDILVSNKIGKYKRGVTFVAQYSMLQLIYENLSKITAKINFLWVVNMVYMQRLLTLCYIGNIIERFTSLMYNKWYQHDMYR